MAAVQGSELALEVVASSKAVLHSLPAISQSPRHLLLRWKPGTPERRTPGSRLQ